MTDTADGEDRLRRLGEAFAGQEAPTVVALLADAGEPGASWRGAAALGDASAAQRRTLLVNLAGPGSGLDRFLGVDGREGLEAVRSGDRALSEAAVHPPGRDFLYLPSGDAGPGDRPRPTEDRGFLRALGRLAGRVREARGLLLLYLEAGALPEALAGELVEAAVPLAGAAPHLPAGVPALGRMAGEPEEPELGSTPEEAGDDDGRETAPDVPPPWVEPEEPGAAADEASAEGEEPDRSGWRRHRRRAGPPWGKIAAGVAVVLLLAGGWWWLADRSTPGEADAGETAGRAVAGAAAVGSDSARDGDSAGTEAGTASIDSAAGSGASSGAAAGSASSAASASPAEVAASAPELPHSVLVASYSSWPAARERAERLRAGEGGTWVVAPTPVRGSIYWRLYAGAEADEDAARRLMERLVERGVKDEARSWDVRPASLTYRVATLADRAGAEERAAGLRGRGIPAFVLTAAADADTVWQVCAGAFESRRAARAAGEMLASEGVEAELVTRRGEGDGT